jgi:hypothetical protein
MSKDKVKVEFKEGKKITKHPTGVTREYTKQDLNVQKQQLIKQREIINELIAHIDKDLADMGEEKKPPRRKKRRRLISDEEKRET